MSTLVEKLSSHYKFVSIINVTKKENFLKNKETETIRQFPSLSIC